MSPREWILRVHRSRRCGPFSYVIENPAGACHGTGTDFRDARKLVVRILAMTPRNAREGDPVRVKYNDAGRESEWLARFGDR